MNQSLFTNVNTSLKRLIEAKPLSDKHEWGWDCISIPLFTLYVDYKRIWQKINGRQKDSFTFSLFYRVRLFICSIYLYRFICLWLWNKNRLTDFILSFFLSHKHTHIHTAHWSMQGETPQLWLQDGFSHHFATLLWNYSVGLWQEVRWWGNAARWRRWLISEWEVIILPHLSYLLVLRVLWPEVAAHCLKLDVEMRQPVEQIHPPRRRIIHHGRHPDAAACRLSLHSLARFLTGTL